MAAKGFKISFSLTLFEGASNAEARQFVQEALMRMYKDLQRTTHTPEDLKVFAQIQIPKANDIEVTHG